MGRGSGGGGGGGGSNPSNYGGIKTISNTGGGSREGSFASASDPSKRIVVKPVTGGTDNQNEFATTLKTTGMQSVDQFAERALKSNAITPAQKVKAIKTRNTVLKNLNNTNNVRVIIDSLKDGGAQDPNKVIRAFYQK